MSEIQELNTYNQSKHVLEIVVIYHILQMMHQLTKHVVNLNWTETLRNLLELN